MKNLFPNFVEGSRVLTVPPAESIGISRNTFMTSDDSPEFVILPEGLKTIGESAFRDWESLKGIYIPESVERIEDRAFNCCSSLEYVKLPSSLISIGADAFAYSGLKSVMIPEGIKEIASGVFSGCNDLATVVLPQSLEIIAEEAFKGICADSIDLPTNLRKIDKEAFMDGDLQKIVIPDSVEHIGDNAFSDNVLETIALPRRIEYWGQDIFSNSDYDLKRDCPELRLPDGVKAINEGEFQYTGIQRLFIPATVEVIHEEAFDSASIQEFIVDENNPRFASVNGFLVDKDGQELIAAPLSDILVIPEGVSIIGKNAFIMGGMDIIIFPSTIKTLGADMLEGDQQNMDLGFKSNSPEDIQLCKETFACYDVNKLYVPAGSIGDYREHPVFGGFDEIRAIDELMEKIKKDI